MGEWHSNLGRQRALAVRDALLRELNGLNPRLATQLRWIIEDRGRSTPSRVEIYLWAGPTSPPVPPVIRVSPEEALNWEPRGPGPRWPRPEDHIRDILRTLPPLPPRRSFNQMFWQRVDDQLDSVMSRLNLPGPLTGLIRRGVHAAISGGSRALLNQIVGATGLPSSAQQAIQETAVRLLEEPIVR